jgi:hypothetical protein
VPTTSTARQGVPVPDFSRAARLGSFLSAFGWLVVVVGVVVGLFVSSRDDGFSVPVFLLVVFGALLVGLLVVGAGRTLEIAAYVGDQASLGRSGDGRPAHITLPGSRRAVPGG